MQLLKRMKCCHGSIQFSHSVVSDSATPWSAARQASLSITSSRSSFAVIQMKVKVKLLSHVRLSATPWTVAHQAPPSMGFSRQEYWSGLPFPSPGDHPGPGIKPRSPVLQADALTSEPPGKPIDLQIFILSKPSEKDKGYHLYVESIKKKYKWTYLQNRNRLTDIENKLMVTKGERWCGG